MSGQLLSEAKKKIRYTPDLKSVLKIYPTAVKSKDWPEIARLAAAGQVQAAKDLAARDEVQPHIRRRNIMARRQRIERVELFSRLSQAEKSLRSMLNDFTKAVSDRVMDKGTSLKGLKPINETLHSELVLLRRRMNVWFLALIKDSMKMGFRHAGNALTPIFKHNQEAVTNIIAEQALFEARLSFGLNSTLSNQGQPGVKTSSAKWTAIGQKIVRDVAKDNLQGMTPSERIWDLTSRSEADLKRIIANGIGQGNSPYKIAKSIERYVSPDVSATDELGIQNGPGVYRSPYRNAMRIARTETNRAYTQASAQFAKGKSFIQGIQITLSPNHDVEDECDDLAAMDPVSADEFADLIPAHPHCMCTGTFVIDPKALGEEGDE